MSTPGHFTVADFDYGDDSSGGRDVLDGDQKDQEEDSVSVSENAGRSSATTDQEGPPPSEAGSMRAASTKGQEREIDREELGSNPNGASRAGQKGNATPAGVVHDHEMRSDTISGDGDVKRQGHDGNSKGFGGGLLSRVRLALFGKRELESDLNLEMIEELHMMTGFTPKELRVTRSHFLRLVEDIHRITREEFLAIPSVANNPLRERLLVCFGFDTVESLEFKEFVEVLAIFNNPASQRDLKLRTAFTLVDMDGDGQVSKNDLVQYLKLITAAPEGVKLDLEAVAARVIKEGVSTPGAQSLSLADYMKIMGAADFDDKLMIPL